MTKGTRPKRRKSALEIAKELDRELKAKGITATFTTDSGSAQIGARPTDEEIGDAKSV